MEGVPERLEGRAVARSVASMAAEVEMGSVRLAVESELSGGSGASPLALIAAGLASCEAIMASMVAEKLGVSARVAVEARLEFSLGEGLVGGVVVYRFSGVDRDLAEKIVELVERSCPVYNTLSKAAVLGREIIVE